MTHSEFQQYGLTGDIERDGILTPEQYGLLDSIQVETAATCLDYLDTRQEGEPFPLVAMATGFGKGKIIHEAIGMQRELKPDSKILVIAGTKLELVKQTQRALGRYQQIAENSEEVEAIQEEYTEAEDNDDFSNENDSIEEALKDTEEFEGCTVGYYGDAEKDVQVTTIQRVQSLHKRGVFRPGDYDLVIVDEVHNIGTKKRYEAISSCDRVIGFTATPYRHSGRMKTPEQYGFKVVKSLPLPEAQEMRFLPPLFALQINTAEIANEIPMTRKGKIDYAALERQLKNNPDLRPFIVDKLIPLITLNGNNYKTVVAVNFVWEAQEIAELLHNVGIRVGLAVNRAAAKALHNEKIPALDAVERYRLSQDDENGIQVLISPYVAGEGFDAPQTEFLVWASPTDSPLRYTQYTGRLARRAPGKAYGVVVDCLYQTNQYNWSYNFGMWMKGNVQQLGDGRLYLGPIQDIEDLSAIQQMQQMTDTLSLEEMQKEQLLPVQERDFPVDNKMLMSLFVGSADRLRPLALNVLEELARDNPGIKSFRRGSNNLLTTVATDRELFIQMMQAHGAKLREDIQPVGPMEFIAKKSELLRLFLGNAGRLISTARAVAEELGGFNSGQVREGQSGSNKVLVFADERQFVEMMLSKGVKLRTNDTGTIQTGEMPITVRSLVRIFIGNYNEIYAIGKEVAASLRDTNPELVQVRRNGAQFFDVVTSREIFIENMIARGVKLRDPS